jgi:hypothetical protein
MKHIVILPAAAILQSSFPRRREIAPFSHGFPAADSNALLKNHSRKGLHL